MFRKLGLGVLGLILVLTFAGGVAQEEVVPPTIDGEIVKGEYQNLYHSNAVKMFVYWTIVDDVIYIGLEAPAQGYLAWGIEVEVEGVDRYDIVMGFVKDGELATVDVFASEPHPGHRPDVDQGGTDDILAAAGSEANGVTTIEFSRKLNTGDEFDNAIVEGALETYIAYHREADDFTSYHGPGFHDVYIDYFAGWVNDFPK